MKFEFVVASVGLVASCTRPNPDFCDSNTACKNGQVCDLGTNRCTSQDASSSDAILSDALSTDATLIDAKPPCVPELAFQRGGVLSGAQVFRVDLMSFVEKSVSNGTDIDYDPAWSPDGTRIAVVRNGDTLWTVDPDGGNARQVDSRPSMFMFAPAWSHDGLRLAYEADPNNGGAGNIYSAPVNGTSGIDLTPGQDAEGPVEWSPDDQQILFESKRTGDFDVFTMSASGANIVNVTNRSGSDGVQGPHWMHGGADIVFGASHIWTMTKDGANPLNLTGTTANEDQPVWSSDDKIYYVKNFTTSGLLYVMNANGSDQHPLMNSMDDTSPVPSPDGTMIAWVSIRDGNQEIYVANSDGSNIVRLTNNPASDGNPRWRPCP